jgi:methylenetetrahydrofolate reductase (NADPH)
MKISQKIEQSNKDGRVWWSFEYFPPRTAQVRVLKQETRELAVLMYSAKGLQNLLDRIERMRTLGPEFIDITWRVYVSYTILK